MNVRNSGNFDISHKHKKQLKCFYTNARSIRNKFYELLSHITEEEPDIVFITETWVKFSVQKNSKYSCRDLLCEYQIDGYSLFYYERLESEGGGVFTYIKDYLNPIEVRIKENTNIESVWVSITCINGKKVRLGNFYRPEHQNNLRLEEDLFKEFEKGVSSNYATVIVGDFNYRDINWDLKSYTSSFSQRFLELCDNLFLSQYVAHTTRGNNILDLILSNEEIISDVEIGENLDESDHQIIRFNITLGAEFTENKEKILDFKKANWEGFINEINSINWENTFYNLNCNQMWTKYKSILFNLQIKYIPLKRIRSKKNIILDGSIEI